MEKYISAEIAQRLKALGFKERVLTYYENGVPKLYNNITGWDCNTSFMTCVSRPTYSEVFRWFREKYGVHSSPRKYDETKWWVEWGTWTSPVFEKFEEAELSWLEKLIEIVESKSE